MAVITKDTTTYVPEQAKIKNLFKRDPETNVLLNGTLTDPVLGNVTNWTISEKIDGMNIRVHANQNGEFLIGGKSKKTDFSGNNDLLANILDLFGNNDETANGFILSTVNELGYEGYNVTLFGEGYGPGIQGGDQYGDEKGFILYDVAFTKDDGRKFFANPADVQLIAEKLGIPVVQITEGAGINDVVGLVRDIALGGPSQFSPPGVAEFMDRLSESPEGVVAYPAEPLYDSFGERIVFKLKAKDVARFYANEGFNNITDYDNALIDNVLGQIPAAESHEYDLPEIPEEAIEAEVVDEAPAEAEVTEDATV